jgi:hypothetical protein
MALSVSGARGAFRVFHYAQSAALFSHPSLMQDRPASTMPCVTDEKQRLKAAFQLLAISFQLDRYNRSLVSELKAENC